MSSRTICTSVLPDPATGFDNAFTPSQGVSRSVLFITDELFLPQTNGSSQIYTAVARRYADLGWHIYGLSFYRSPEQALSTEVQSAYGQLFNDFLLLPGWNCGGTLTGLAGMTWRELSRWSTGNVFATHPFLVTSRPQVNGVLRSFLQNNRIDLVYFHKLHTILLLEPLLQWLSDVRLAVDIHDDFVARDDEYAAAFANVFRALPWHAILTQHLAMYVRRRCSHTNQTRSRRREVALLRRCDQIYIASQDEHKRYAAVAELRDRVEHKPWPSHVQGPSQRRVTDAPFDAGFIGADNVMNLDAVLFLRDAILPHVYAQQPDFRMLIAGTITRKLAVLLRGVHGIEIWHRLEDVAEFYAAVASAAIPLRHGTGVSVKAIEALSHGCRVVTTSVGIRGLQDLALSSGQLVVRNDPAGFASALLRRPIRDAAYPVTGPEPGWDAARCLEDPS